MITPELIRVIRSQYRLQWRGIHGIAHWARVLENGLRLASLTGASIPVVSLFAVFHDSQRFNDDYDPQHGLRGGEFAASLCGTAFELSDSDLKLLVTACSDHTNGLTAGDVTVQTCWDADRLDLGRVGIRPNPKKLCTDAAKHPEMIEWSYRRSRMGHMPAVVAEWNDP